MPAPRLSQSAEAARAAAQQAEFNEKKWVWVPDAKEGYLAGWVNREEEDAAEVIMAAGGEFRRVPFEALFKMNPPKFDRVDDIADLTFLNEASVVHNLRLRYGSGAIYTYSGLFLVAINPYQNLPLYSDAIIQQYRNKRRDENPPHIFAVAERAWVNMGEERENQSILITGESGAGKTESTKKVIQYLAAIATDAHLPTTPSHSRSPTLGSAPSFVSVPSSGLPRSSSLRRGLSVSQSMTGSGSHLTSKGRLGLLERQILQANPILEAFGNAQTQRNNNSSRFGKFIRITFAPDGSIAGANIDWYLLEKSRVVVRSEAERSFHVFYQLLTGGVELKNELLLGGGVEDYEYLNKSRREVDGVDDREEWNTLKAALDVVGLTPAEQFDLFRVVAAILHIGNITITSTRADDAVMPDPSQAERVCHLLGIPVSEFTRAVLRPQVLAGREWVSQARTRQQALDELAALCKTLYEKSFGALVDRINRALDRPSSKSTFIGVLDIAGFEIFETNAYEQLLINYTNEKLQQFFNHHMFVLEQEEYAREGIKWDYVNFGLDLQPTIDLIEASGSVIGILSLLDEECIMPKATDQTFTNKLNWIWAAEEPEDETRHPGRDKYEPARFEQGFIIQHYAAKVEYRTDGWLEKNKDPLNDHLTRVLASSSERYIASLFAEYGDLPSGPGGAGNMFTVGKKRALKKGAFRTVAQRHKEQLASLMQQLKGTQPHFVRCIVPNSNKKPGRVDVPLVLDQLRCNGVLEGIRIARLGYPNRLPFVEFRQRYEVLTPGVIPRGYMDGREACRRIVNALELDEAIYKIGTSKIFFKAGVLAELEERRDLLLFDVFSRLQAVARKWTARRQMKKVLNRAVAIRTIQRNARVYGELRDWPWWQLYTKVRPLLAATRDDEALRKKEAELALIKERAEREKQEKEALENLKMSLEAEKRKVEDELEAERALALDKDALLERSKKREVELEEEVAALQSDLDTLDSQLDRAMKLQRETEAKHEALMQAFDQAAEHLVRLENEQKDWGTREAELNDLLAAAQEEIDTMRGRQDDLQQLSEELKNLALQREEDLARAKERMDVAVRELEGKLAVELRNKDLMKSKHDDLEKDARHAKEQLAEMARTATEYSTMIQKKEEQIAKLSAQLDSTKATNSKALKEIIELQNDIETLVAELDAVKGDREQDAAARKKLQEEVDQLRFLMEAKTSEESRRNEVERRKEEEIANLRAQVETLQQELAESRRVALEGQSKLKVELDQRVREYNTLLQSHKSLSERDSAAQSQLSKTKATVADLEKAKRSMESELQSLRSRQHDYESQVAEATKAKESLERQLSAAQAKYQDFEDTVLEIQRQEESHARQLKTTQKELEEQSAKRAKLEQIVSNQKVELGKLKDINIKIDRELNKALNDLKAREWEVKQLESKQDKTIVEHVHVLEEAKRVTDRQLEEARKELEKNAAYIRSLEKAKTRLAGEAEDLVRETEKERIELRNKEKNARAQEERAAKAAADVEKERRAKEVAELQARRVQAELDTAKHQIEELTEQVTLVQRSKDKLEAELERIADETESTNSLAKFQRQYEARIAELEGQVEETNSSQLTIAKIKDRVERQHAEIRQLIMNGAPTDKDFQARLLHELQLADSALEKEMSVRARGMRSSGAHELRTMANLTPTKRVSHANLRNGTDQGSPSPRPPDKQVAALKQQVQVLELQMAASERVRRHLETSLREMTSDLENSDGSKQFLQQYRSRLSKENARLAELLEEEAQARRAAEAAQIGGVQAMWTQFQNTIATERENYSRLEESRKALLVQQRTAQADLEAQRAQIREFTQAKKQLQGEVVDLRQQLEVVKNEASDAKRELAKRRQEDDVNLHSSSAAVSELRAVIETYKAKEQTYQERLEATEIARAKAARGEAFARRTLTETEKLQSENATARKIAEDRLKKAEARLRELEAKLEEEGQESSETAVARKRLQDELEDEREQHKKDLAERDFAADQTRKKYQAELAQLSEELQSQRDTISRLREDNRKVRSDYDELQLRYDDEVYNSGGWKKEKERMETKISDINKAYEASTAAQAEQQTQIVALHSQVRELRAVLDDAEADRAMLQKARRALQAELETIKLDHVDTNKMSTDTEFQRLQLKKQDLERSLEEQEDRVASAFERMKKAEAYANECQIELGKVRVENSELDKLNAHLEKQIKELNVRIVDLETKSYANSPRGSTTSRRTDSRIEELTSKLTQTEKDKTDASRRHRSAEKIARDAKFQAAESDRARQKLEEERKAYETQLQSLRQAMDTLQTEESNLQAAKRRAEREAADYKQKALNLERELERLHNRLERPAAASGGSPRK
ncbi:putative TRAFAC class myosin-kinesin ATPase superfamily, myosin family protein [Lyophyllum shimeji]|uniref:TRAFAC class myosin-kinesin ATPase superfamily, myosin family protein n=1 Tax=Lyophyllum shimeji TaxID=47721 RepID=A0A9P3PR05_LYOSH|nr:putative TRAFAC class myosin-kinesin ATPase superfamily, myosin family protein [Lyophyllum shimeji]